MNLLILEPYYDGSHKAFLDGWRTYSRHQWTLLTLPGYKWKWRMRHAAITLAQEVRSLVDNGHKWDAIFCSDMLNLAEFRGLLSPSIANCPTIVYFHENQLTYPVRTEQERDYQFAMTNITTALCADKVWFNSLYHQDSFLSAAKAFMKKMPDYQPIECLKLIQLKSEIHYPGIHSVAIQKKYLPGSCRILWAARWEHDKNPEDFFAAINPLVERDLSFRLSVIGQHFREKPPIFDQAYHQFVDYIDHWGFQKNYQEYLSRLLEADIVVSTALHEFFGIGIVEAIAAGAYPLLPRRLSYPELLGLDRTVGAECFFYDGTVKNLSHKLDELIRQYPTGPKWSNASKAQALANTYEWSKASQRMDVAIEDLVSSVNRKRPL